jgi:hypothetical protein
MRRATAAAVALICGAVAHVGAAATLSYPQDVFFVLNGAWRVLCGQTPHTDFYTPFGPVIFLIYAGGLKLASLGVEGIGYGIALTALAIAIASWRLVAAAAVTVYLTLLAAAPYPLGMDWQRLSHAMSYNRIGYALLSLVLIEAVSKRERKIDGAVAGGAAMLLLFLKASYFLVALGLMAISLPRGRRLTGMAMGAAVVLAMFLAWFRLDLSPMAHDLRVAGSARTHALAGEEIGDIVVSHWQDILRVGVLLWLTVRRDWRLAGLAAAVFGGSLMIRLTNNQGSVLPPLDVLFLLVIPKLGINRVLAGLLLAPVLFHAAADAGGIGAAVAHRVKGPDARRVPILESKHLERLWLYDGATVDPLEEYNNGRSVASHINDGLRLLREHGRPGESVVCPELADPFAYAALRPPAAGGYVLLAHGFSYTDGHRPSNQRLFGTADLVLLPKGTIMLDADLAHNRRNFFPYIERNFAEIGESEEWRLLRRRGVNQAAGPGLAKTP